MTEHTITNQACVEDLPRHFGFWTGVFVLVSSMIGSGIFVTSGFIVRSTASHPTLLGLWMLGGLLALCGALTIAEMATALPRAGGDYVFIQAAYGPAAGFVFGWSTFVVGFAAPIAVVAQTAAVYLLEGGLVPAALASALGDPPSVIASVVIVVFTALHCLGQRHSAWVQGCTTLAKVVFLAAAALAALILGKGSWSHLAEGEPVRLDHIGAWGSSLILVMYTYTGWNGTVYLAGEIKDPPRLLPRCLVGGCLFVTALYLLVNLCYVYAIAPTSLAGLSDDEVGPIAHLTAERLFSPRVSRYVSLLIGVGILSSVSAFILTGPRVAFAMARNGLFPAMAGVLHAKTGTPAAATVLQGIMALGFLWTGTLDELLRYAGTGLGVISAAVLTPIFVFRRDPRYRPSFRVPFYPLPPLVFLGVSAWMIAVSASEDPTLALISVGSILLGFPLYFALKKMGWLEGAATPPRSNFIPAHDQ